MMDYLQLFLSMTLTTIFMFGGLYWGVWIVNKITRGRLFNIWNNGITDDE